MYINRAIENVIEKALKQTKVVLLTGARQVGKSTVITEIFKDYDYITLDDDTELMLAKNDAKLFFRDRNEKIAIDEVQYVPEIFNTIKFLVDKNPKRGQIILTGSQTYELLMAASQSLVGRVSLLEMEGLSLREIFNIDFNMPFLPTADYISERKKKIKSYENLWSTIHRGSMPDMANAERDWEWFYRDYVRTYLERDINKIIHLRDEIKFRSFLVSLAARSAQILVYEDIASDVGVDIKTVQSWLSIVNASGIVKLIHTYQNNANKRMIKSPKIYFMDTGLLCYLVGWKTPETARSGAQAGSIFETFIVSEIIKSYLNVGKNIENTIFYYRDKEKREIDLIIEDENTLYPIEIKSAANVTRDMAKGFSALKNISDKAIGQGAIICRADKVSPVTESINAIPVEYI